MEGMACHVEPDSDLFDKQGLSCDDGNQLSGEVREGSIKASDFS
jgi:hypothetical protein